MLCEDSTCTTSTIRVVDRAQVSSDVQLDMSGNALLAYRKNGVLRLARCQGQDCENLSVEVIDQANGRAPELVLDSVDNPVILYADRAAESVKLVRCDNANCASTNEQLPEAGTYLVRSVETGRYLDADRNGFIGTSTVPKRDDEWDLALAISGAVNPYTLANSLFVTPISNTDWTIEPAGDGSFYLGKPWTEGSSIYGNTLQHICAGESIR